MKKYLLSLLTVLSLFILISCKSDKREEPTLEVPMELTVKVGVKTDITEEIEAKDQDGLDIKDNLTIESDDEAVEVDGNYITVLNDGSYIVKVTLTDSKDKNLKVSKSIFVDAIPNDEVVEGNVKTYTFDEVSKEALNGFKALVEDEEQPLDVLNGELVYENGKKDTKLVKELSFKEDETYNIELVLRANKELNDVSLTVDSDELETEEKHETINDEYVTLSINVSSSKDVDANLVLDLNDNEDYTLYVERLFVETSSGLEEYEVDLSKFEYINEVGESTKEIVDGNIVIDITDPNAGIWEQKLIKTGIELESNKKYVLTYDIKANEDIEYEFIARTLSMQEGDRDENYIWSAPNANKDEVRHIKHTFETNDTDIHDFEMFFQFGGQKNPTVIEISNINIDYYNTYEEETVRFTGLTDFESHEEGDGVASLYVDKDEKALVYDVENFAKVDWHNKVFVEDIVFEEDSRYKVEFTAKANKAVSFFFAVNPMGDWAPKISDIIELSDEYQTFTFETDSFQSFTQNFEILFQFGEHNEGSATIMFESIVITQLVRK